ncbi:MAG: dihydroxy-acid dehydratase [Candidatus Aenigmarchaeota archaeon ex4484_52]|nr:MAG: dihydroxy-acid dehydratase [Candidatus Aenigmarchaeota archaeon ex4484_52]
MKSDILKNKIETMPHRALLMSAGLKKEDFSKPFIGVANSYNDIIPGHIHLNELTKEVKRGIRDAGGVPLEWGVPGVCDGIAMFVEMRLSLPSRDHIADNIEIMTMSHSLDGWVGVTNCDKITPGMLMAAGRLDLPAIILTGGPMKANTIDGKKYHPIMNFGIVGQVKAGKITKEQAENFFRKSVCGQGSCVGLFTANTMATITEVLGMSITGCATTLAIDPLKKKQAYVTGKKIVELVRKNIKPSSIMTKNAFENAIMVDMAMGGSTNAVLHIIAIAKELNINISANTFDKISSVTPNICNIIPAGNYEMADIDKAGGISAVLNRLKNKIKNSPTVNGKSIKKIAEDGCVLNDEIIRPLSKPYHKEGGIAVLKGNIAKTSVIKQTAVCHNMMKHTGPAKVFYTEDELLFAIEEKKINEGDVVVLPFQGPAGAPGMPEMLTPTDAIKGAGYKKVALITDGRFSGGTTGACIGHIEPEAYLRGAIGIVRDNDIIDIDIPNRKINLKLTDEQIEQRIKNIKIPERKLTPYLRRYKEKIFAEHLSKSK